MPLFYSRIALAFATLTAVASAHGADPDIAKKTRELDERTQALKREILELGRNIAYLSWVGGVKPAGDLKNEQPSRYNLKALSDDTVRMGQSLALLEDGVLSPPGFQLVVFASLDAAPEYELRDITLKLDDKIVMRRRYEAAEIFALRQGGAHRLYIGDLSEGKHKLEAFVISARDGKPRQDVASVTFVKRQDRKTLELKISGSRVNPEEWD